LEADGAGEVYSAVGASDRSVHVFGDFGSGTCTIQGSNDPLSTTWATLHDLSGADLVFTVAGIQMMAENPQFIRPSLTGSSSPALRVNMLSKGGHR